jgi:hypothetical protein
MSRARLEERIGEVVPHGRALLSGYAHRFDHQGSDGTAKGNIIRVAGDVVQGVVYALRAEQVQLLEPYEGGYDVIEVELELVPRPRQVRAYTYTSQVISPGLAPLADYLEHYFCGMLENGFPEAYVERIRRQAKR